MAQYGGEQYRKEEGHQTDEHAHNPLYSTTATGTNVHSTTVGHDIGGAGNTIGTGASHGNEEGKHGGTGGILHRSGSGSSSSSEDDGEGGRRKKGVVEKIKEKLPGGDHGVDEHKTSATDSVGGGGHGYEGDEGHEKKGLMEKIKENLPGGHQ